MSEDTCEVGTTVARGSEHRDSQLGARVGSDAPQADLVEVSRDIQDLCQLVCHERTTFHVFRHRDRRFLYDLNLGALLELDEMALLFLEGLEYRQPVDLLVQDFLGRGYPVDALRSIVSDVRQLQKTGLFAIEPLESPSQRDVTVQSYLSHRPRKMMLMIQTSCNLKCNYCYEVISGFHHTAGRMTYETAVASVEGLIARSGNRKHLSVTFFGGEPLLNFPLLKQVIAYCEQRGPAVGKSFYYHMTTNATLLTPEIIDYLVSKSVGVMISCDGPPEKHDIHRVTTGGHGTGATVLANAKKLIAKQKEAGLLPASIRVTMTAQNQDYRSLLEYFRLEGFDRVMIGASDGRAHHKDEWDVTSVSQDHSEDLVKLADDYLAWLDNGQDPTAQPLGDYADSLRVIAEALEHPRKRAIVHCGVGRNMLAHTADGRLFPCHRYAGENQYQIGTITAGIDKQRLEDYYRDILKGYDTHCSHCWARYICGGQCAWYISRPDGRIGPPDKEGCDSLRAAFERQLWLTNEVRERQVRADPIQTNAQEDQEREQAK